MLYGETYTLTAYYNDIRMSSLNNGYAYAYAYKSDGTRVGSSDYMYTSTSDGISTVTITNPDISYLMVHLGIRNCIVGDVYKVKLEKGNRATDWTPAPEDVDADIQKVDDGVNDLITDLSTNYYTKLQTDSAISVKANEITQHVSETYTTKGDTEELTKTVESKMDAESFNIAIQQTLEVDGVKTFKTKAGFTFGENGLDIIKDGAPTSTNIDENGMDIIRSSDKEKVLVANDEGVTAFNLWAKTYLIIGETSRLEDYVKNSKPRTGCFWTGG